MAARIGNAGDNLVPARAQQHACNESTLAVNFRYNIIYRNAVARTGEALHDQVFMPYRYTIWRQLQHQFRNWRNRQNGFPIDAGRNRKMQVRVADQAAGVFDAEYIAVTTGAKAQRQLEAAVGIERDRISVNCNDVAWIRLAAQAIRILGIEWFRPRCCAAWIVIRKWLIFRFYRRVKMQVRQLNCRLDTATDFVDHLQINAGVVRRHQRLRELTPVIHSQLHTVHGDQQFVGAGLVHSCALDRGQLTDDFHSAVQRASGIGRIARNRTIFTETLNDKAVWQHFEFADEIVECCIGSRFGEQPVVERRAGRVRMTVYVDRLVRVFAHDFRRVTQEPLCMRGQLVRIDGEGTAAEFKRD